MLDEYPDCCKKNAIYLMEGAFQSITTANRSDEEQGGSVLRQHRINQFYALTQKYFVLGGRVATPGRRVMAKRRVANCSFGCRSCVE